LASILAATRADKLDPTAVLGAYLIFLALEVSLAVVAVHSSHQPKTLVLPASLYLLSVAVPDASWKGLLLLGSLLLMFFVAIGARFRKTRVDEERQLAEHGRSPWPGKSRQNSTILIRMGIAMMVVGTAADAVSRSRSILTGDALRVPCHRARAGHQAASMKRVTLDRGRRFQRETHHPKQL
jgi:hypothetical protein